MLDYVVDVSLKAVWVLFLTTGQVFCLSCIPTVQTTRYMRKEVTEVWFTALYIRRSASKQGTCTNKKIKRNQRVPG